MSLDRSFKQIAAINTMVGNQAHAPWPHLLRQARILLSEAQELVEACEARDETKARDGAADVAFVLAGFEHMSGVALNPDLVDVIDSNLTKFDVSEYGAAQTARLYSERGIATRCEIRPVPLELQIFLGPVPTTHVYVTYVDGDQQVGNEIVPDGKWLKSYRFIEPVFEDAARPMGQTSDSVD